MRSSLARAGSAPPLAVGAISLGCPKNLVDTEVMLGLLREAGFALVTDPEAADVLLVNTCCFIEAARRESAEALEEAAALRREGKAQVLVCAGCWSQMDPQHLRRRFPEVDALMGPGDVGAVVSVLQSALDGEGSQQPLAPPSAFLYDDTTARVRSTAPWTAYLKIAEGCGHRCSFCVIPRLRGRYRSRPLESVVREAEALASQGVREINLVAQDTTAYGRDRGGPDISRLLVALAAVSGIKWIRLLYGFPARATDDLIEVMAREPSLCKYIDLPFQHVDAHVLRRMGRAGEGEQYLALIARLREAMPDIAIRSTFLVGFPGEGEREFGSLLQFLEAAQLDRAGAFCYSAEPGTPAADMPGQVPPEVAQERYHELMVLQQRISLARNRRWLRREMEVLVEAQGGSAGEWLGRSFRDAPEIDGSVLVRSNHRRLAPGRFVRVEVVEAQPYDLIARLVSSPANRRGASRRR